MNTEEKIAEQAAEIARLNAALANRKAKIAELMGEAARAEIAAPVRGAGGMPAPTLADTAKALVPRLQSFLDRLCNDQRAGTMFEGDGDTLRDAITLCRFAGRATAPAAPAEQVEPPSRLAIMEAALQRISRWFGEFHETGKTWDDGTPMSYGAANGSNGERDYMRQVASDASAATPAAPLPELTGLARLYVKRQTPLVAITFDDFVQYGRENGANIVNGMPWSFKYKGLPISHENDNRYLIPADNGASFNFTRDDVLVTFADGSTVPQPASEFASDYMPMTAEQPSMPAAAQPAALGAVAELDRIKRLAACATVDSFLALPEQDKRYWFAMCIDESERRKLAEERFAFLHSTNKDAEGYEYGVCKVKHDAAGQIDSFLWCVSDHSDIDAARASSSPAPARHPDDIAVDAFADAMKAKMAKQRDKGYSGWESAACDDSYLADQLFRHAQKGDPVDVGNFAMMLHQRNVEDIDIGKCVLRIAALDFAKRVASMWIPELVETAAPGASIGDKQ